MANSTTNKELLHFLSLLDNKQKEAVIAMIKSFIRPQTIEEYNRELDEANERIERGEFITADDLKKEMQTW
ncbi:MAG TPA: hypothetical protein VIM79_11780 [Niastella sp.]